MEVDSNNGMQSSANTAQSNPALNPQLARPEPIRASEFVDPLLLQSLTVRPDAYALNAQLGNPYSNPQLAAFSAQQQPWGIYPLMNPMQLDLRSFYNYIPAPPLKHEEKDRDSGNETGSLSPGTRTPLTNSPSSIPSRSNSFSVNNILKVARNNAIAQLSPVVASQAPDQEQTPTATKRSEQLAVKEEEQQTPQHLTAAPSLLVDQQPSQQWMPNTLQNTMTTNLQNPYIGAYPATAIYNPQMLYQRPGVGVINPLDYYQFQPQLAAMMSMTAAGLNTRELCVICNDKASGFHYSVLSCEGCKGFFRRTVQKGITYQCHRNLQCVIDRGTRNRCQRCRFDKCIASGMSRETVRNDRSRRKKLANDENDGRVQEHKKLNELSEQLRKAYEFVEWSLVYNAQVKTSDEFLHLISKFMDKIPTLNKLSPDERQNIARQRFLPLILLRVVHLNESKWLNLIADRLKAEERVERYQKGLPAGLDLAKHIHLISALFLTKSTTSSELSALNSEISSALFTQLFAETNSESSFRDYLALSQHFFVLSD